MTKPDGYPRMGVRIVDHETLNEAADFAFDNILKSDDESKRGVYVHGYGDGYRRGVGFSEDKPMPTDPEVRDYLVKNKCNSWEDTWKATAHFFRTYKDRIEFKSLCPICDREFHACNTGDCDHKTQAECDAELDKYDSEIRVSPSIVEAIKFLSQTIHADTKAWWKDLDTGDSILNYPKKHLNTWIGTKLMLVCSEIGEAMEGLRKDQMDDKLPHRPMIEVELADAIIRILDLSEGLGLDVGGAMAEKLEFNRNREDFKVENRKKDGGKSI